MIKYEEGTCLDKKDKDINIGNKNQYMFFFKVIASINK